MNIFVRPRKLGIVTGADGTIRLFPGLVRMPDVAFASWNCFPDRKRPRTPIPHIAPDLVVEVLSKGNTKAEMARKLREYFDAGVRIVWMVDRRKRTVHVYSAVDKSVVFTDGPDARRRRRPARIQTPAGRIVLHRRDVSYETDPTYRYSTPTRRR